MALVVRNNQRNRRDIGARDVYNAARMGYQLYRSMPKLSSFTPQQKPVTQSSGRTSNLVRATHELKNASNSVTGASMSITTYTPYIVNPILQGTSSSNRTGRQVMNESLRLCFKWTAANSVQYDGYRVIVVYDTETRGAAPGLGDILTSSAIGASFNSSYFEDNKKRFKILLDKSEIVPHCTALAGPTYTGAVRHWTHTIPLPKRTHYYNTSAGTVADIDSGSIYIMFVGLSQAAAATYDYDVQLWFRDV